MELKKIMNIQELKQKKESTYKYFNEKDALEAVKQNGDALQYVHVQTENICLEAVKQDGYALRYVHVQTPEICLEAVKQNGYALQFVHICLEAVKQDGDALRFVNPNVFPKTVKKLTVSEIETILGEKIEIIAEK